MYIYPIFCRYPTHLSHHRALSMRETFKRLFELSFLTYFTIYRMLVLSSSFSKKIFLEGNIWVYSFLPSVSRICLHVFNFLEKLLIKFSFVASLKTNQHLRLHDGYPNHVTTIICVRGSGPMYNQHQLRFLSKRHTSGSLYHFS